MESNLIKTAKRIQNSLDEEQLGLQVIQDVISLFLSDVVQSLLENKEYSIKNFGVFYNLTYPERSGCNPINGKPYTSRKHRVPKFKFAKKIKTVIKETDISKETITTNL